MTFPTSSLRLARASQRALFTLVALLACVAAFAQRPNDPTTCPYCHNDPAIMAKAGIVSHGGFKFGATDTAKIDELLATCDIRWIETKHFQIGTALGVQKVKDEESKKIFAELSRLAEGMPEVNPKVKVLDPWLRSHLYAQRCEDVWKRFIEILQIDETKFPDGKKMWDMRGTYMGEGPYIGMKDKYEVLSVPSEAAATSFLQAQFGLLTKLSQRWNVIDRDTLILVVHQAQGGLREDGALHGHIAFNITINLLDGYKHYTYETPIWIREGLAHFIEREINPKFNTFDSSEGAVAAMTSKQKWEPEVRKLVAAGTAIRMAELLTLKDYAGLKLEHHFTTWSMVDYLIKTNPTGFAKFNEKLHGITNSKGIGDGSNLLDVHRKAFQEFFGMGYAEFDAAWAKWVQDTYSSQ